MKAGGLPQLSDRLGELTRTNSEALGGAMTAKVPTDLDLTRGVAITASFNVDEQTHIENCRYGPGSNLMGALAVMQVDGGGRLPRVVRFAAKAARHPAVFVRSLSTRRWSERTVIALVMQSHDNSITVTRRRGPLGWRLTSRQGHGEPSPTYLAEGNVAVRTLAAGLARATGDRAWPGSSIGEVFDVPMTAHFLGGAVISDAPQTGVIDPYHRVWGYPGLHVVDGAAVSANLGVNPSLTITAQAERAMSFWPRSGEPDGRPAQGLPYSRARGGDSSVEPRPRSTHHAGQVLPSQ